MIGSVLRIRYELTALLTEGPIFTAFSARDRVQGREVSIRLIKPPFQTEPEFVKRLSEVVARYSAINHPGVETLKEVDEDNGQVFIVGEATKGTPLSERIRKLAPFSVPVSVSTTISLLEALEAIHQAGLTHGDVGAHNVAQLPDGQVRVQLPGVWEAYSASPSAGAMVLPNMAGYLAPEISAGSMPSRSTDIYAVGVLLYELLTGRLPHNADTPVAMALKHATAPAPSVRVFNPSVPSVLDEIIKKSLAKEPNARYASAADMLSDLRMLQDALRFGRTLTWPIRKDVPAQAQPVAPRMSAVREEAEPDERKRPKRQREPGDVPLWLIMAIVFCAAVVVALLGAWVVFNINRPKLVNVPNLRGSKVSDARATLRGMGLTLREAGREPSEKYPTDTVIEVDPGPGEKVHEGATVSVKLSSGSQFVEVPDLRGTTLDDARSMLANLNLELDDRVDRVRDRNLEEGLIVSQLQEPRSKVQRFSKIRVRVSAGRDSSAPSTPEEDETPYLYTLKVRMTGIPKPVVLRVDITDSHGTRTVFEREEQPDQEEEIRIQGFGKEATFKLFYDGHLVKQITQQADEAPEE